MNEQLRIFGAPSRYLQGAGAIASFGEVVRAFSGVCFVIADGVALDLLESDINQHCREAGVSVSFGRFGGECTHAEIKRMAEQATRDGNGVGVIVGLGGGKTIDTAKGASLILGLPMVIVPTIASNDSPTSRLVVVYDEEHRIVDILKMDRNPDAVLVDTAIIAKAPVRFLISGIGDAISKKFETELCARSGGLNFYGGHQTTAAFAISDHCYSQIRKHAVKAIAAVRQNTVTPELDAVVEAAVLLSGLGFENGGLAIAHGLNRGLAAQEQSQSALHGELVAWGLLVQLIADHHDDAFVAEMSAFYRSIGLPVCLKDIGFTHIDDEVIEAIANVTWRDAPYVRNIDGLSSARLATSIQDLEQRAG